MHFLLLLGVCTLHFHLYCEFPSITGHIYRALVHFLFVMGIPFNAGCIYRVLGIFLFVLGISFYFWASNTMWVRLVGSPFLYLLGKYRRHRASFYQPLSWCFTPWPWVLWSGFPVCLGPRMDNLLFIRRLDGPKSSLLCLGFKIDGLFNSLRF